MTAIGEAASIVAVIQISKRLFDLCQDYYSDVKDAKKDIERLDREVIAFGKVLEDVQSLVEGPSESLTDLIKNCSSELEDLQKSFNLEGRKSTKLLRALTWPFKSKHVNKVIEVIERYKATFNLELTANIRTDQLLAKLPLADGATFDSSLHEQEAQCLPDTRVELLDQIMMWSDNPSDKCIFWLNGMAGTGKSTIARTVASKLANNNCLGGSFFFTRGGGDLSKATMFFTSLTRQLVNILPSLKRYVCEAIAKDPDIAQKSLDVQWKQLIFRPLSMLDGSQLHCPNLVLVIDALDECESEYHVRTILHLLPEAKDLKNTRLQVFLTSRPETTIRLGFDDISATVHQDFVLHSVPQSVIEHDISIFIKQKLADIRRDRKESTAFPADWPSEQIIKRLAQRADGLFIYAATACRFIGDPDWSPEDRLHLVLEGDTDGQSPTWELDEMYTKILQHSVIGNCNEQNKLERSKRFRQIVGSIVILFDSLSITVLARLLDMPVWKVDTTLGLLRSVLDVPKSQDSPIRLLHPSFHDFLLDEQRCLDHQFWVHDRKAHNDLAESCLQVMSKSLRKDICGLHMPGASTSEVESSRVGRCIPADVQYACRYWVDHLQRGEISLCDDNGQVHIFLQKHFLHWLEALSLMGKMSEGVLMLISLQSMLTVSDPTISYYDLTC
jgi:NACHT domain